MPPKFLALERGDGARFLHKTSFFNDNTETYPPPCSPIDCEMQGFQHQYNSLNIKITRIDHNMKLFGILFLVLLTTFLCVGIVCLMVGLKIPFLMQFIEEHFSGIGSENEEVLDVQPDLSLNLVVPTETSSSSPPEVTSVDIIEDGNMQIWDLTPWGRDST